jgi:hypothetical protein
MLGAETSAASGWAAHARRLAAFAVRRMIFRCRLRHRRRSVKEDPVMRRFAFLLGFAREIASLREELNAIKAALNLR